MRIKKIGFKKWLFFVLGFVCLVLAYLGIVLPGFPGTPFILLTAFFFMRSSDRMFAWLMRRRLFSKLVQAFEKNPQIPFRLKIVILLPFWISILVAELFFVRNIFGHIAVVGTSLVLTFFVLRLKTVSFRNHIPKEKTE
jgi:uncharacterized membrane protein YbaN (DUF454 family)